MALLITTGKMLEESRAAGLAHRFRVRPTEIDDSLDTVEAGYNGGDKSVKPFI